MEMVFHKLFEIFSPEYMFSVIVASYLVIKLVDLVNGDRAVPTWAKRTITAIVGAALFWVFAKFTDTTVNRLIASYFSAIFVYETAIKFFIKKLGIGYK